VSMRIALALLALAAIGVAAGCGSGDDQAAEPAGSGYGAPPPTTTQAAGQATVSTKTGELGTYLADADGRTLYLFEKDTGMRSRCSGACAQAWPPLISRGKPVAKGRAKASLLSTSRRGNGSRQVTYGGHPLYRFAPDTAPGQTLGQGVDGFGALWWVVARSGNAITSSSSPGY
jgi:predicted lipoprotein with Yx(FWY)xxD motif